MLSLRLFPGLNSMPAHAPCVCKHLPSLCALREPRACPASSVVVAEEAKGQSLAVLSTATQSRASVGDLSVPKVIV